MQLIARYGPYIHKRWGYRYFVEKFEDGTRRTVYEHREIMEKSLGRKLGVDEQVHHRNENKVDNKRINLQVMSISEHSREHGKTRVKTMVPQKCDWCEKEYEVRSGLQVGATGRGKRSFCSKTCFYKRRSADFKND